MKKIDQIDFIERLSFLLGAGISILESLAIVRDHSRSASKKKLLDNLVRRTATGIPLTESLTSLSILDAFSISILRMGEMTGTFIQNLRYAGEQLRKTDVLRKRMVQVMIYPSIIFLSTAGLCIFLVVIVFPKIRPLFMNLNVKLPLSTRIILRISSLPLPEVFFYLAITSLSIIGLFWLYKKAKRVKQTIQNICLKVPIFGFLYQHYILSSVFRMLGLLLKSGIGLEVSTGIVRDGLANLNYQKSLTMIGKDIERGKQLSQSFKEYPKLYPLFAINFISIGESTGNLSEICVHLSEMYERDIDDTIKKISSLIEPLLMIVMGIIVGFVALSVISPIYEITQNIK